jgi:hypothetical protein
VTAKKHRAIVFDLDNKSSDKTDATPTSVSRKTVSVRPTVTAKPTEEPSEYGTNSLGNVRVRPLSPARQVFHFLLLNYEPLEANRLSAFTSRN